MIIRAENTVVTWSEEKSFESVWSIGENEEAEFELIPWSFSGNFHLSVYKIPYITDKNIGTRTYKIGPEQHLYLTAWSDQKDGDVSGTFLIQAIIKTYV